MQSRLLRRVLGAAGIERSRIGLRIRGLPEIVLTPGAIYPALVNHPTLLRRVQMWVSAPSAFPHRRRFKKLAGSTPAIRHCLEPFRRSIVRRTENEIPPEQRVRRVRRAAAGREAARSAPDVETNVSDREYSMGLSATRPRRAGRRRENARSARADRV